MISKKEYIEYLLSTPFNYTCTNLADHKPNLSHDVVSDFLRRERFTPADLWAIVQGYIADWPALQVKARKVKQTIYQLRTGLFSQYLTQELANLTILAIIT